MTHRDEYPEYPGLAPHLYRIGPDDENFVEFVRYTSTTDPSAAKVDAERLANQEYPGSVVLSIAWTW